NSSVLPSLQDSQPKKRKYNPRQGVDDKLAAIFLAIGKANWAFSEFRTHDNNRQPISRTHSHASHVQQFLHGHTKHTPAVILDAWFHHPDGRIPVGSDDEQLMYSTAVLYTTILPVQ
ncbi:hypothetical protein B0H21DRAFT_681731, partial [Amylocystis lapponica]